jgi:hypothetical protein
MVELHRRVKHCLPPAVRSRVRRAVAALPLADRFVRVQLCPWRVGFVVGGVMKGGTTALSAFLDGHPEVRIATGKEAHFFDTDEFFPGCRRPDYDRYHAQFAPGPDTRLLGDATPMYIYWDPVPARVATYNPAMKWILLLRHPAERAYSHWNMLHQGGEEPLSFAEALAREPERLATLPNRGRPFSYLDRGYYARQLRRLFAVVPRRQMLVLRSEELRRDHHATLRRVFEFLGVDRGVRIEPVTVHARPYEEPLSADLRRTLTAHFADDLRDLERLLGWDLSDWLADRPLSDCR